MTSALLRLIAMEIISSLFPEEKIVKENMSKNSGL